MYRWCGNLIQHDFTVALTTKVLFFYPKQYFKNVNFSSATKTANLIFNSTWVTGGIFSIIFLKKSSTCFTICCCLSIAKALFQVLLCCEVYLDFMIISVSSHQFMSSSRENLVWHRSVPSPLTSLFLFMVLS